MLSSPPLITDRAYLPHKMLVFSCQLCEYVQMLSVVAYIVGMLLFYLLAHTLIVAVSIMLQMSSSIKEYWEKRKTEVGAEVMVSWTRKPQRKRQTDSTDNSSSQEKVKANPKAKAKAKEQKWKNDESYTKKSTQKQATASQVANSKSKKVSLYLQNFMFLLPNYYEFIIISKLEYEVPAAKTNMIVDSDKVE